MKRSAILFSAVLLAAICSARVTLRNNHHHLKPHASLEEESGEFQPGFVDWVKQMENSIKKGYNPSSGLWYPHDSPEGGTQTIGYGHKLAVGERLSGLTQTQVEALLRSDLIKARTRARTQYGQITGTACSWEELDGRQQDMLTDYAFNVGTIKKFPKFTRALSKKDYDGMLAEYKRTYTDADGNKKELPRNAHFHSRYLSSRSEWTSSPAPVGLGPCSYRGSSGVCMETSLCTGTPVAWNQGRGASGCKSFARSVQCCITNMPSNNDDADDEPVEDGKDNDSGSLQVPNYKQCDAQWACHPYKGTGCATTTCKGRGASSHSNNMCRSACGVASSAMLLSFHEQRTITPVTVANWLMEKKYRGTGRGHPHGSTCSGTSHIGISKVAESYGYTTSWKMTAGAYPGSVAGQGSVTYAMFETGIQQLLSSGHPVILHVREVSAGTCKFTNGGHYIVLTSYDASTKHYRVNDPGSSSEYRTYGTRKHLFKDCAVAGYTAFKK